MTFLRLVIVLGLLIFSIFAIPAFVISGDVRAQGAYPLGIGYTLALQSLTIGLPVLLFIGCILTL